MIRIFLDSSVLFSAAYSSRGHSRDLLVMAAREDVRLVISLLVLEETKRNIAESAPELVPLFELLVFAIPFEYVRPTKREVLAAAKYVEIKDAPIVAAAKKAKIDFMVTLDKKHLLGKPELVKFTGAPILTPKEAFAFLVKTG